MRFSILMANYNGAKFIKQSVNSVLKQTFQDWELIFVDDCSKDKSLKIIRQFDDPRIKIIERSENGGYGKTLQTAAENATGEIWGVLDSDDALRKDALQIMIDAHNKNPEHGFIYSQYVICNENLKFQKKGDNGQLPQNITWLDRMSGAMKKPAPRVSHFKTFTRESYLQTHGFTDLRRTVDKDLVLKIEEVTKLLFINEPLYLYRAHAAGISRSTKTVPNSKIIVNQARKRRENSSK